MRNSEKEPVLHGYLIGLLVLEHVPGWLTLLALAGLSLLVGLLWPGPNRPTVVGVQLAFGLADWASLALLPRYRRSFGPVKPPLFALALTRIVISMLVGLIWPRAWLVLAVQSSLTALSIYATWIEPFRLQVTRETLHSPRLEPSSPPIRLLHFGDIHIERITRREIRLQQHIDELSPDLILFSGDFVNLSYQSDSLTLEHIHHVIRAWRAPLGVYCISGTPLVETPEDVRRFVADSDIRWLRNEATEIEVAGHRLTLAGVDGALWRETALPDLSAVAENASGGDAFRILLYHTPDVAPEAAELGFDLQLSGHTHGGQLRLPFFGAIITASELGKRFEMGRYRVGDMTLYVTRGVGMEGGSAPRARFLCPPEITLWTLSGTSD